MLQQVVRYCVYFKMALTIFCFEENMHVQNMFNLCKIIWWTQILQRMKWGKIVGLWVSMAVATGLERVNYNSSVFGVFTFLSTGLWPLGSYLNVTSHRYLLSWSCLNTYCIILRVLHKMRERHFWLNPLIYLRNCNFGCPLCPHVRIF